MLCGFFLHFSVYLIDWHWHSVSSAHERFDLVFFRRVVHILWLSNFSPSLSIFGALKTRSNIKAEQWPNGRMFSTIQIIIYTPSMMLWSLGATKGSPVAFIFSIPSSLRTRLCLLHLSPYIFTKEAEKKKKKDSSTMLLAVRSL